MRLLILVILISATFSADASDSVETRVRVREAVKYKGFVFSGKHWLAGTTFRVSDNTLSLRMTKGGGLLDIALDNITELQTRKSPFHDWQEVHWPSKDIQAIRVALGTISPPGTNQNKPFVQRSEPPKIIVAYIEESGTEVLVIHPLLGSTIDVDVRTRFGLFANLANFESAQYLRLRDGQYAVRITSYDENGILHTATRKVSEVGIQDLRRRIEGPPKETSRSTGDQSIFRPPGVSKEEAQPGTSPSGKKPKSASFRYVAVGLERLVLPSNDHPFFDNSPLPDGETINSPLITFGSSSPYRIGYGVTWTKYEIQKSLTDSNSGDTATHKYSVSSPVFYLSYTTVFGDVDYGPRVGLRTGAALNFITFKLLSTGGLSGQKDDTVKLTPYVGVDGFVPLGSSKFGAFAVVEKIWVTHDYNTKFGRTDVQLGPILYGAGIAYRY